MNQKQQQQSGQRRRRVVTPLYDARYEHDACGVGFVADAGGGRSRARVLPLALAGLAALGHRGAFGADGESSDGAGVALPLDRSVLELLAGDAAEARPGVVSLFLPRGRAVEARARALVEGVLAGEGLSIVTWRAVPCDPDALGSAAALSRPAFAQAIVARPPRSDADPRPVTDDAFERRLIVARRRLETAARAAGGALAEIAVPSASARTVVYKGLVIGGRLPDLYPDLRAPLSVALRGLPPAVRDEHPAGLAARPAVPLDLAQRRDQHGPRQSRGGPRAGRRRGHVRCRAGAPGRRTAAVRGRLRFALARRRARAPDGDRLGPDRRAPDRDPGGAWPCGERRIRMSPRCGGGRPGSWRRGTGRRRSSSPTGGRWVRWSIGTGCGRRPSP